MAERDKSNPDQPPSNALGAAKDVASEETRREQADDASDTIDTGRGLIDPTALPGTGMIPGVPGDAFAAPAATGDVDADTTDDPDTAERTRGPSVGAIDVAHGQPTRSDVTGDTAPRRNGGQAPDPPRSLGSAGGGATGPGSSTIHEPSER